MTKDEIKTALECCNNDDCINCPYISYSKCRDILIDAALNLITEQEEHIRIQNQQLSDWEKNYTQSFERLRAQQREIDKLKADYANLQEQFAAYQIASDKEIRAQVKQAKIDGLNELKTHSYYDDNYMDSYVFVSDIDELIEEVAE